MIDPDIKIDFAFIGLTQPKTIYDAEANPEDYPENVKNPKTGIPRIFKLDNRLPNNKRQRLNHIAVRDLNALNSAYVKQYNVAELALFLPRHYRYYCTPGFLQRCLEHAYGFTPLEHGQHLFGWEYRGAFEEQITNTGPDFKTTQLVSNFKIGKESSLRDPLNAFDPFDFVDFPVLKIHPKRRIRFPPHLVDMAATGDSTLFEEVFTIIDIDDAKYDRVARLKCSSGDNSTLMTLDVNSELFPCFKGETLTVVLATSLALDGSKEEKGWRDVTTGEATMADMYDYVCHGKLYKFEDTAESLNIKAYVSFGGLLMQLEGPYKKITPLRVDYLYLLMKK